MSAFFPSKTRHPVCLLRPFVFQYAFTARPANIVDLDVASSLLKLENSVRFFMHHPNLYGEMLCWNSLFREDCRPAMLGVLFERDYPLGW